MVSADNPQYQSFIERFQRYRIDPVEPVPDAVKQILAEKIGATKAQISVFLSQYRQTNNVTALRYSPKANPGLIDQMAQAILNRIEAIDQEDQEPAESTVSALDISRVESPVISADPTPRVGFSALRAAQNMVLNGLEKRISPERLLETYEEAAAITRGFIAVQDVMAKMDPRYDEPIARLIQARNNPAGS